MARAFTPEEGSIISERSSFAGRVLPLMLFAAVLAAYLLSMPIRIQAIGDASVEVGLALHEGSEPRPYHLLLTGVYHVILKMTMALGGRYPPFIQLQWVNCLFGAGTALLLFHCLRRVRCSARFSAGCTLVLAFSFAQWVHSREVESSIIAQFFWVASLLLLIELRRSGSNGRDAVLKVICSGLCLAAAALLALNYVLLVPVACLFIVAVHPPARGVRIAALYGIIVGLVLVPIFYRAFHDSTGMTNPVRIFEWISRHPDQGVFFGSKTISILTVLRALTGLINLFTGYSGVTAAVDMILRGETPIPWSIVDCLRLAGGGVLVLVLLLAAARMPSSGLERGIRWLVWSGILVNGLFNTLWLGSDPQFWLPAAPLLLIGGAAVVGARDRVAAPRVLEATPYAVALMLIVANIGYPVPTVLQPNGGSDWRMARRYAETVSSTDLLLFPRGWGRYVTAFGEYDAKSLVYTFEGTESEYIEEIAHVASSALDRGGRVYLLEVIELTKSDAVGAWEEIEMKKHVSREDLKAALLEEFRVGRAEDPAFGRSLWLLQR